MLSDVIPTVGKPSSFWFSVSAIQARLEPVLNVAKRRTGTLGDDGHCLSGRLNLDGVACCTIVGHYMAADSNVIALGGKPTIF